MSHRSWTRTAPLLLALAPVAQAEEEAREAHFANPIPLTVDGELIKVESPGYASPAWHDVDGDGRADLVVGQFRGGKMRVYTSGEDGSLSDGGWLEAGGEIAEVPGVW